MKKVQFVEMITSWVQNGVANPDLIRKYHPEMIALNIGRAFNHVIYATFRNNISDVDLFAKPYVVEVQYDSEAEVYYFDMPAHTTQLPDNKQIRQISFLKDKKYSFEPLPVGAAEVFGDTDVALAFSYIGYTVLANRIELTNWPASDFAVSTTTPKLRVILVPAFEAYEDEDEVHIPSGKDIDVYNILLQILAGKRPTDMIADGNTKAV